MSEVQELSITAVGIKLFPESLNKVGGVLIARVDGVLPQKKIIDLFFHKYNRR